MNDRKIRGANRRRLSPECRTGQEEIILVVKDAETVRLFAIFPARDAQEALEIFRKEGGGVHLVFTDIVLPDHSCVQRVDERLSVQPDLKVLLTTGYTEEKAPWAEICENRFRLLRKPYGLHERLSTVARIIHPTDD